MTNEPPCWILDENYRDTGKRNYSNCHPMCCTSMCTEPIAHPPVHFESANDIVGFEASWKSPVTQFKVAVLSVLRDVDVQKAIRAIAIEHVTPQPITFPGCTQEEVENIRKGKGQVGK